MLLRGLFLSKGSSAKQLLPVSYWPHLAARNEMEENLEKWSFTRFIYANKNWDSDTTGEGGYWERGHHLCHSASNYPGPKKTVKRISGCPWPCLSPHSCFTDKPRNPVTLRDNDEKFSMLLFPGI